MTLFGLCEYQLEESNDSFNYTLAEIKDRMRMMISTTIRIVVTTACTQCNINGYILEEIPSWWKVGHEEWRKGANKWKGYGLNGTF